MSLSLIKYPQSGGSGDPLRFGVSGEDDLAAEFREFSTGVNDFAITESTNYNAYIAFWQGQEIDLYSSDGNGWTEFYMTPTTMSIWLDTNSNLEIDGITQDDTAIQILALDNSGNVKFVDKTTIGGAGIIAYKTTGDVRGTFDTAYYDISSLAYTLAVNEHVVFEVWIDVFANGLDSKLQIVAPAGADYVAHYTATDVSTGGVIADYQALGMNPSLLTTQFNDKLNSIILPTGPRYQVRIVGTVVNGATPGDFKFQHGTTVSGGGSSIVYAAGFMRTTTIT